MTLLSRPLVWPSLGFEHLKRAHSTASSSWLPSSNFITSYTHACTQHTQPTRSHPPSSSHSPNTPCNRRIQTYRTPHLPPSSCVSVAARKCPESAPPARLLQRQRRHRMRGLKMLVFGLLLRARRVGLPAAAEGWWWMRGPCWNVCRWVASRAS